MWLNKAILEVVSVILCTVISGYSSQNIGRSAPQCSYQGELVKGLCQCYPGYSGYDCSQLDPSIQSACINPDVDSDLVCSGRGNCVGGRCECSQRRSRGPDKFTGEFCECDDYSCPFYMGQLCGGPNRGTCRCGVCQCMDNYSGESCGCSLMTDGCMASNGKICNNAGECVCGHCQCFKDSRFRGKTCEERPGRKLCRSLRKCVQCRVFQTGPLNTTQCVNHEICSNLRIHSVERLVESNSEYLCQFKDENDCLYYFGYSYDKTGRKLLQAQTVKDCPGDLRRAMQEERKNPNPVQSDMQEGGQNPNPVQSDSPSLQDDGDSGSAFIPLVSCWTVIITTVVILLTSL